MPENTVDLISEAINAIRPALQNDGGDVEFKNWDEENNIVHVQLTGACAGCPMSQITLTHGVQRYLREALNNPGLIVINDSESENPYF